MTLICTECEEKQKEISELMCELAQIGGALAYARSVGIDIEELYREHIIVEKLRGELITELSRKTALQNKDIPNSCDPGPIITGDVTADVTADGAVIIVPDTREAKSPGKIERV